MRTCRRSKCSALGPAGHPVDGAAPGAPESAMGDRKGGWPRVVLPGLPASGPAWEELEKLVQGL